MIQQEASIYRLGRVFFFLRNAQVVFSLQHAGACAAVVRRRRPQPALVALPGPAKVELLLPVDGATDEASNNDPSAAGSRQTDRTLAPEQQVMVGAAFKKIYSLFTSSKPVW